MTCGLEVTPWGGLSTSTIQWRFCVEEGAKERYVVDAAAAILVKDQSLLHEMEEEEEDKGLEWFLLLGNLMLTERSWIGLILVSQRKCLPFAECDSHRHNSHGGFMWKEDKVKQSSVSLIIPTMHSASSEAGLDLTHLSSKPKLLREISLRPKNI